jgi:RHS repeat-associated protein
MKKQANIKSIIKFIFIVLALLAASPFLFGCNGGGSSGDGDDGGEDTTPPALTIDSPDDGSVVAQTIAVTASASDNTGVTAVEFSLDGTPVATDTDSPYTLNLDTTLQADGNHSVSATARDAAGNTDVDTISLTFDNTPPTVTISSHSEGETVSGQITLVAAATDNFDLAHVEFRVDGTSETIDSTSPYEYSLDTETLSNGNHGIASLAVDEAGNQTQIQITLTVDNTGTLPPDPMDQATPVDPTETYTVADATAFLYTGNDPIQTGVDPAAIERRRGAVVSGKVADRNGDPISGVTVTILNHDEYGQTLTRVDGAFDMAVNGGGILILSFVKDGLLTVQRKVNPHWNDYTSVPDVVMIGLDDQVTAVDLSQSGMKVARGSLVSDDDGSRQATLLIPEGTTAQAVFSDGSTQNLNTIGIRATEYTVGDSGFNAMPAELPALTGYTYALEYSADEALDASQINFSQALYHYQENFLGFPVGSAVPTGYYDRIQGQWIASENGRVIAVVDEIGGLAELDIDGDGSADDGPSLDALNIDDAERSQLADLYDPGDSLWRVPITHFTPWDLNWTFLGPEDAEPPNQPKPDDWDPKEEEEENCEETGSSIIECRNRVLREDMPLMGTPVSMHYRSDRVRGHTGAYSMNVPLTGNNPPASLKRVELVIRIAGRSWSWQFDGPGANLNHPFEWDGLDTFGRDISGHTVSAQVIIAYVYDGEYVPVSGEVRRQAFARLMTDEGSMLIRVPARREVRIVQTYLEILYAMNVKNSLGYGGWSLSLHHSYDPVGQILERGDGTRMNMDAFGGTRIEIIAGDGEAGYAGDGGDALEARFYLPRALTVSDDGSVYIADTQNNRIRRINPDGTVETVVNLPVIFGVTSHPRGVAVAPDGDIYIAEYSGHRIRKWDSDTGLMSVVAGIGPINAYPDCVSGGDDALATQAQVCHPSGIALGDDGSLYIAEEGGHRIRHVGTDGIITTVAGGGGLLGDGGPATDANLDSPADVSVGPDGSLYIADSGNRRIRHVSLDGLISTVAGGGGSTEEGIEATSFLLGVPTGVTVRSDGRVYLTDFIGNDAAGRIRVVRPDGNIYTVAGGGDEPDSLWARRTELLAPYDVAIGPDDDVYTVARDNHRVFRIGGLMPGIDDGDHLIPSRDGSEVYQFDARGRHLSTLHPLTGDILYAFSYNEDGYLTRITDVDGNVTSIQRDGDNTPYAVVGPQDLASTFTMNVDGYLDTMTDPAGRSQSFDYTSDGLLTGRSDAKGLAYSYLYDDTGRLVRANDPAGGYKVFTRSELAGGAGYEVTKLTAEGIETVYRTENLASGDRRLTTSFSCCGQQAVVEIGADGTRTATYADGTETTVILDADPRWGMMAPVVSQFSIALPSGATHSATTTISLTLDDALNPLSVETETRTVSLDGNDWVSIFDGSTRTLTTTSPEGRSTVITLDSGGAVTSLAAPGIFDINYSYDDQGRLESLIRGSGADTRATSISYNAHGQVNTISHPEGQSLAYEYDGTHRLTTMVTNDGRETAVVFDDNGNLTALTPPGKTAHQFDHTDVNRLQEYDPPDTAGVTQAWGYSYNLDRQITGITRADGSSTTFDYDDRGRLTSVSMGMDTIDYTYDDVTGQVVASSSPYGVTETYRFDGSFQSGQTWDGAVQGSIDFTLNNAFLPASLAVNATDTVNFQYDNDGHMVQAGDMTVSHDADTGYVTGTTLGLVTTTHDYNGFAELETQTAAYSGSEVYEAIYTRDTLGRITTKTETLGGITNTFTYLYDAAGRLQTVQENAVTTETYAYDANGNRTSANGLAASFDAQDRMGTLGGNTYTYTSNGELATKTVGGDTTSFTYSPMGALLSVDLPNTENDIDYVIDAEGRRVGVQVGGVLVKGFLYKGLFILAELDGSHNVVSRFIYGTGDHTPDYMVKNGTTYGLVKDYLGSVRLVMDVGTGTIAQRLDYDAFGRVITDTAPGFQPFGFAGGLYDPDTGLTRFGARDYDAEAGRWTAKDPIRFHGGDTNLYAYVGNNPVNAIDPTGLQEKECTFKVTNVKGDVTVTPQSCKGDFQETVVGPIEKGFVVKEGDVIETGPKTRIRLYNEEINAALNIGINDKVTITNDMCFGKGEWPMDISEYLSGKVRSVAESFRFENEPYFPKTRGGIIGVRG